MRNRKKHNVALGTSLGDFKFDEDQDRAQLVVEDAIMDEESSENDDLREEAIDSIETEHTVKIV